MYYHKVAQKKKPGRKPKGYIDPRQKTIIIKKKTVKLIFDEKGAKGGGDIKDFLKPNKIISSSPQN
jgi:hypothetical protein